MADQLAAHCKLPRSDRAIVVIQHATFALEEWGLPEDPLGLENLVEPPPADEPAYRPRERHPIPTRELARGPGRDAGRDAGTRQEARGGRREEASLPAARRGGLRDPLGRRPRRSPCVNWPRWGRSGCSCPTPSCGTRPRWPRRCSRTTGAGSRLAASRSSPSTGRPSSSALRPSRATGRRPWWPRARPASPAEMRRSALAALRRRLRECDGPTIEHLVARLLEKDGLREVKVAKRGRESVVFTGRRRMGLVEVRHAIRVLRTGADVGTAGRRRRPARPRALRRPDRRAGDLRGGPAGRPRGGVGGRADARPAHRR